MLSWTRIGAATALASAAAVASPVGGDATGPSGLTHPADPAAPVPALVVEPVIRTRGWLAEPATPPDQVWRAANDALREGESADPAPMSMPMPAHAPAAPMSPHSSPPESKR